MTTAKLHTHSASRQLLIAVHCQKIAWGIEINSSILHKGYSTIQFLNPIVILLQCGTLVSDNSIYRTLLYLPIQWYNRMGWIGGIVTWCLECTLLHYPVFGYCSIIQKAFHKNAKTCRAGFHKKPTKQDGTHMTIRSQITIPTSIFPTTHTIIPYSLFWNGCVYLCVVNSRIGLWVGVCIEGSRE